MIDTSRLQHERVDIAVDSSVFSLTVVRRTAHRFSSTHFVEIENRGAEIGVALRARNANLRFPDLADEFRTALLDDALRERVIEETSDIRKMLYEAAFAGALRKASGPKT